MSELIQQNDNCATIRWKLLTGASAIALATCIWSLSGAEAAEAGRPTIWLEASGQFDQLDDSQEKWTPEFVPGFMVGPLFDQFTDIQRRPRYGFDAGASVSFQPEAGDWLLRASVRIGKARQPGSVTLVQHSSAFGLLYYRTHYDGQSHINESHAIIDFQTGRDVGLGTLPNAASTVLTGIRIAQLQTRSDVHVNTEFPISFQGTGFNDARTQFNRKFDGVGPSIAWDGSVPIAGNAQEGELDVDWTAAAAILFGRQTTRQKSEVSYQANRHYYRHFRGYDAGVQQSSEPTLSRQRNVVVPNLGGLVGVSYRWPAAKLTLGYRADFFFNAIDGGIATRKEDNRGFFGPYVSISVGIGGSDN